MMICNNVRKLISPFTRHKLNVRGVEKFAFAWPVSIVEVK